MRTVNVEYCAGRGQTRAERGDEYPRTSPEACIRERRPEEIPDGRQQCYRDDGSNLIHRHTILSQQIRHQERRRPTRKAIGQHQNGKKRRSVVQLRGLR